MSIVYNINIYLASFHLLLLLLDEVKPAGQKKKCELAKHFMDIIVKVINSNSKNHHHHQTKTAIPRKQREREGATARRCRIKSERAESEIKLRDLRLEPNLKVNFVSINCKFKWTRRT